MHPEAGLPILNRTLCRVGSHLWRWSTTQETDGMGRKQGIPGWHRCDCGLLTWADREPV